MAIRRRQEGALAAIAALSLSIAWTHGCGIDLSKNDLAGRACKNQVCLPGYVCSENNTCILDTGSGGNLGSGGSDPEGGTQGVGGSTEGTGGTEGTGPDPDASVGSGGTAGGSGGTGGTAASGGTGGSGGTGDGGGSGGTGGATGGGGLDGGNPWPGVGCLQLTCTPAEVCCVANFPGFPTPPLPTAFRCATAGATCAYTLHCDGDHDCPTGQRCCAVQTAGGWVASCAATCANPPYHVQCTKPDHCASGLVCCGVNFQLNRFDSVTCRPSCNDFNDRPMCNGETDCTVDTNCQNSAVMPGFKTCQ